MPSELRFVTETRGGWDEWDTKRRVLTEIELPDGGRLSPFGTVRVKRDGEAFDADLEPVNSFGEPRGDKTRIEVESWRPEFTSEPLSESDFREAWGEWIFPAE